MANSDMKVGDIGVLQKREENGRGYMNGMLAEIRGPIQRSLCVNSLGKPVISEGYLCAVPGSKIWQYGTTGFWVIPPPQIRPITDPDEQTTQEQEETVNG